MSWKDFCENNKIPKSYHDCKLSYLVVPINSQGLDFSKIGFDFIRSPTSLILQGDPGRGKSHFMFCLIHALLEVRRCHISQVRFFNAEDLDNRISDEIKKFGSPSYFLNGLLDPTFLFIDDFGVEGSKERAERNYYTILDKRLANDLTTILSTNLNDSEILSIFGSRIDSRLKQCVKLVFDGPDLRKPRGFS